MKTKRTASETNSTAAKDNVGSVKTETQKQKNSKKKKVKLEAVDSYSQARAEPTQEDFSVAKKQAVEIARMLKEKSNGLVLQGPQPKKMEFPLSQEQVEYFIKLRDSI